VGLLTNNSASDFSSARQKAFIEEWLGFFTGRPTDLLSFEEIKHNLRLQDSSYKGLQEIELDKIVGSIGRYRDFTRTFLPKNDQTAERWRRVDAVASDMQGYPPIDVYQVGDVYFVRDGNHRVSVARMHDAKTIEAYVTEYKTNVPIGKGDDLDTILLNMERTVFLERTGLDQIRPDHGISFTEPGRYRRVQGHIAFHKHLKEVECNCEISTEEAVASWYDNVYMPVVEMIRRNNVLNDFPDRTEADLYVWLTIHRSRLEQEYNALGYVPDEDLLETIKRERATNPFARLMGFFRHQLDLANLPLKVERSKFLEQTRLDELVADHGLRFTEPGCYQLAKEHIGTHKYLRETESDSAISYDEAVISWYYNVYMPVIELVRERNVTKHFPKNTEGDLYIWLVSRRKTLEEEKNSMGQIPTEKVIWDLENEISSQSILGLRQFFGKKLDLDSVLNGVPQTA
jgi:hypothetical protein